MLALTLSFVASGCGRGAERQSSPAAVSAVILIDIDTLRADGLGTYGNPHARTPNLDEFAAGACRFEWAFAQAPYTLPSQVSILTSIYPHSHGVVRERDRLAPAALTLAEVFQAESWTTAAFVDGGYVSEPFGFAQGFDTFVDGDRGGLARSAGPIREWLTQNRKDPFFLLVHTYDTHTPYAPPEPLRSRFAATVGPPTPGFEPTAELLEEVRASQWSESPRRLAAADLRYARALYDAEVAYVDEWFGRFLDDLEKLGIAENAVIAVVSDHGEEFGEHGSVLHEKLYATVTRVPMIVRVPGGDPVVIRRAVDTVDLMPTLIELAGLPLPEGLQGRSLASSVLRGIEPMDELGLAHSPFWGDQRAVVSDEFHLVLTLDSSRVELFRYRTDPLELHDLAEEAEAEVEGLIRGMRGSVAALPTSTELRLEADIDPEAEASLRALGYLR